MVVALALLRSFAPQLIGVALVAILAASAYTWHSQKLSSAWDSGYAQATAEHESLTLKAKQVEIEKLTKRMHDQSRALKNYDTHNSRSKVVQSIIQTALGKSAAGNPKYHDCIVDSMDIGLLNDARSSPISSDSSTSPAIRLTPALPNAFGFEDPN
jgi:hypothetical protein